MSDFDYKVPGADDEVHQPSADDAADKNFPLKPKRDDLASALENGFTRTVEIPKKAFNSDVVDRPSNSYRFELLSGGVFYDNKSDVFYRRFKGADIKAMAKAAAASSITALLDVMSATIYGIDVRDMTAGDFKHFMYEQRIKSFTRRPWTREWVSMYGNLNKKTVENMGQVLFKTHSLTKEEYEEYKKKGLVVPTMRDYEYIENNQLEDLEDAAESFGRPRIIYFAGDTWDDKIKAYENADSELIELALELEEKSEHGVVEIVSLKDDKFNPSEYLRKLKAALDNLENLLPSYIEAGMRGAAVEMRMDMDSIRMKINEIEAQLRDGKEVVAEEETVEIPMTASNFLSNL
jgi:hypothetical protein